MVLSTILGRGALKAKTKQNKQNLKQMRKLRSVFLKKLCYYSALVMSGIAKVFVGEVVELGS